MNIVKSSRLLLSMACAISLSACVSFLPDPAPADVIYRLSSQSQTVPAKSDAWVLRIDRPSAAFIFQNQDIIISPDGQRLAAASQAKWAEVTPVLVQEAMVDILSERANLVGVLPASGARTDTRLHLTIKKFEAHFDNGEASSPLAVVEYDVVMAQASTRRAKRACRRLARPLVKLTGPP